MTDIISLGIKYIKEGKSFSLINQYGESKDFIVDSIIFNYKDFKSYVKISEGLGEILNINLI